MARDLVMKPSGLARAADRLAAHIPGYHGYQQPARAAEEDASLREAICSQLGLLSGRMERALARSVKHLPPDEIEEADRLLRALGSQRDRVRFAPAGNRTPLGGARASREILEILLTLDSALWDRIEDLDREVTNWDRAVSRGETGWPGQPLKELLYQLEDALDRRESLLRS